MSNVDNLITFGFGFQSKVIAALLTDIKFLEQSFDILHTEYFESIANQWLVDIIRSYYEKYKKVPTLDVFKVSLADVNDDIKRATIIDSLRAVTNQYGATDLPYAKERFLDFGRNQELKKAILKSVEFIERGEYDAVKQEIDRASKAGTSREIGMIYKESLDKRISDTMRNVVETPWPVVTEIMDGGLGKGELGVIMAGPGVGKTWCLALIGAWSVLNNKNVLHYTLELAEEQIGLRYDAYYSGFATNEIKYHKDEVQKKLDTLKGNIIVKWYPTKTAGVNTIVAHMQRAMTLGFQPDLVIVDYADLLKGYMHHGEAKKRFELENIYEELRGTAGEFQVPIWTATQANRSSLEEDIIGAGMVAEAFSKIMIADFVMSLSRKTTDKIMNTGRVHIIKNRFGPDGLTFPSSMNASNGNIQIFEESGFDGTKTTLKMKTEGDVTKQFIKKALNEMDVKSKLKSVDDMG